MNALDTNVVVHALNDDDPEQTRRAIELISARRVFLPKTVVLETDWVLRDSYGLDPAVVRAALRRLIGYPSVIVEDREQVLSALQLNEDGLDFADALHHAASGAAASFHTFDRRFIRRAARLGLRPAVLAV